MNLIKTETMMENNFSGYLHIRIYRKFAKNQLIVKIYRSDYKKIIKKNE
jgi:hypothetical protein|tara:strand:- start:502 stop:648 length:147 start_codon:yes stop_codon:yes gene_type:complete